MVMPAADRTCWTTGSTGLPGPGFPAAWIPELSMVAGWPATTTCWAVLAPLSVPVVPSLMAVAVVVTEPMVIRPPRIEMPLASALAVAVADGPVAPLVEVLDSPCIVRRSLPTGAEGVGDPELRTDPIPRTGPRPGAPLPEDGGAGGPVALLPGIPKLAMAVLESAPQSASIVLPGVVLLVAFGPLGQVVVAWAGHTGAWGSGTPGNNKPSSGPELAITWPGYRLDARALPVGPKLSAAVE